MDFLDDILGGKSADFVSRLVDKAGFSSDQAEAFVPEAVRSATGALREKAADLDLSQLMSNPQALMEKIDMGALAAKAGIGDDQAKKGLGALLPGLLSALQEKAGGLDSLKSLLGAAKGGSLGDVAGGLAGKLFGGK